VLLTLLLVSLSRHINAENMSKTVLEMEGLPLLTVEIFLLSAASLGSCFQNLQQINNYISTGTYDPKFQSTYWTRWVMGLISGVILSQVIFELLDSVSHSAEHSVPAIVGQPVLALLGGYSVDVVCMGFSVVSSIRLEASFALQAAPPETRTKSTPLRQRLRAND
jgi:hypothetical protein